MFSQLSSKRQKGQMKPPFSAPWTRSGTRVATRREASVPPRKPPQFVQTSPAPSLVPPQRMQGFFRAGFFADFFAAIVGRDSSRPGRPFANLPHGLNLDK